MRKNVAGQAAPSALLLDTAGDAVTTGTTTVYVTGDNGTQGAGSGTVTHEGNGVWSYAPTQAETNYNHVSFLYANTGAVSVLKDCYTDQAADLVAALNDLDAAGIRTALGMASADLDTQLDAIVADTGTDIPASIAALNDFNPATETVSANVVGYGGFTMATGTAQAGAASTITLAAGASAVDDFYKGTTVLLTGGTGVGQARTVESYVGSTKVATVADAWSTNPSTDSTYLILPAGISIVTSSNPIPAQVVDVTAAGAAKMFSVDSGTTYASAVAGSVVKEIADNSGGSALTEAGIADAVWDEARAGHVTAGTYGETMATVETNIDNLDASVAAVLADTGTDIPASIAALPTAAENRAEMDSNSTQLAAIVADTNELQTDDTPTALAAIASHLTDIKGATFSGLTDSLEAIRDRGDAAWVTGSAAPTAADIRTEIDANSTQLAAILADTGTDLPATLAAILADTGTDIPATLAAILADTGTDIPATLASILTDTGTDLPATLAAILADTGTDIPATLATILGDTAELQGDFTDGGRLDLLIDAIKAKTDSLTYTVAGQVDANMQSINDATLKGDGATGSKWGPV